MYPNSAYYEFYPAEIVDKILREYPNATVEQKNDLMQAEWDAVRAIGRAMSELADDLGLYR